MTQCSYESKVHPGPEGITATAGGPVKWPMMLLRLLLRCAGALGASGRSRDCGWQAVNQSRHA